VQQYLILHLIHQKVHGFVCIWTLHKTSFFNFLQGLKRECLSKTNGENFRVECIWVRLLAKGDTSQTTSVVISHWRNDENVFFIVFSYDSLSVLSDFEKWIEIRICSLWAWKLISLTFMYHSFYSGLESCSLPKMLD
jgi:hypothetical protein